jgi:hypothetical protein
MTRWQVLQRFFLARWVLILSSLSVGIDAKRPDFAGREPGEASRVPDDEYEETLRLGVEV